MKKITYIKSLALLIAFFGIVSFGYGQTKIAELTFESPGGYTVNDPEFTDLGTDYFIRTDGSNIANEVFSNIQGSYYFGAQDTHNTSLVLPLILSIDDINIAGYSNIEFRVHLAEDDAGSTQSWDSPDYVHFNYDIDNTGSFSNLLWIEGSGGINTEPLIDTDFDGTGDGTAITDTFTQFTENITGNGVLLDIEIVFNLNAGGEDIAIDNIEIWGTAITCASTVTWNGAWVGGTPDSSTEVIIDANYNTGNGGSEVSFSACSLTISNGAILTVSNGTFLEVENDVLVDDGELRVNTQGNFVQNDNSGTFTLGASGTANVNKVTPAKQDWLHYTYWSSPVENWTIADAFPNTSPERRFWFNALNYLDEHTVGTTNGIPDDIDDNNDAWQYTSGTDVMLSGVGYAATAGPFHFPGGTDSADFSGVFNTGNITTGISYNALNTLGSWNFIGNPYPSSIDFVALQAANSGVIDGAAYFWSQASPASGGNPGNQIQNFDLTDYAVFTIGSGGVAGGSPDVPTQYIPSAQGFFIAGLSNGSVTFTNSMRMADGTSNTLFFKNADSKKSSDSVANKLRVDLTSDNGVFNQVLVSYVNGATKEDDGMSYDAPKLLSNAAAVIYTSMESSDKKFAIQGKAPNDLNENEIIDLGFKTLIDVETLYTLSIAQLQGDFLNNNTVYLKDNLLNKQHNLSDSDYTFTSEVGEFSSRFQIAFTDKSLSTDDINLNDNDLTITELDDDQVNIRTSNSLSIKTVTIYDLLGRQLYNLKGNNSSETYELTNLKSSVYIAKVELSNGATIAKKAIKK